MNKIDKALARLTKLAEWLEAINFSQPWSAIKCQIIKVVRVKWSDTGKILGTWYVPNKVAVINIIILTFLLFSDI